MLKKFIKTFVLMSTLVVAGVTYANTVDNLLRNPSDPVGGNPKGSVTVVEFFDYQCSHCVSMARVLDVIARKNPNLRIVYKEFPIRGKMSQLAAQAALAANIQGKYHALNRSMLNSSYNLSENNIINLATDAGLNVTKLKQDMHSKSSINQLRDNYALARTLHLTGTPAIFIARTDAKNNSGIHFNLGEMSTYELQSAIDKIARQR